MSELGFLRGLPLNCAGFGFVLGLTVTGWANPLALIISSVILGVGVWAEVQCRRRLELAAEERTR